MNSIYSIPPQDAESETVSDTLHDQLSTRESSSVPNEITVDHILPVTSLSFTLHHCCHRARRTTLVLPHGSVETPVFMAVGTHGTVKGVTTEDLETIGYQIILGNTYHLGNRPGTTILAAHHGLHKFMTWNRNLLTDSGGFQMVSLLKLASITEEGVEFNSPVDGSRLMLTPEMSMNIQNTIGADIMMALDDVVSTVSPDKVRLKEATERTTRWLDRCIQAHRYPDKQNLFGIVQGGLHEDLRRQSLIDLKSRNLPGYAIGGLSGGEAKDDFWKIVELCTRSDIGLPENKPRYLMGVGYPVDVVVCVALGVDMFDCVYPTRTARFGTALVPEGTIRLKMKKFELDFRPIQKDCPCEGCKMYTRAFFYGNITREPTATRLLTLHNLTYMFNLCAGMRRAISSNQFPDFVVNFLRSQFHSGLKIEDPTNCKECNYKTTKVHEEASPCPPLWVRDALLVANIDITDMYDWSKATKVKDDSFKRDGLDLFSTENEITKRAKCEVLRE